MNTGISEEIDTNPTEENDGFIPSIFNYCDRWCERCAFTAGCRTFAMEKELREVSEIVEKSFDQRIQDIEKRLGFSSPGGSSGKSDDEISYDFEDAEDDDKDGLFSAEKKSERHPVALLTLAYSHRAYRWLTAITSTCRKDFTRWLALGLADQIFGAIDTISWYHFFIYPKIRRAISGYLESKEDEFAEYDMNGSAKVTLIAVDRSIEAFTFLKRHLKSHRTEMAGLAELLTNLRRDIEELFPGARSFIRPGFDQ